LTKRPRPTVRPPAIKRPTAETRFYIDYDWWERSNLDVRTYILTRLHVGDDLQLETDDAKVDLIDPATGEVRQVDSFQYVLQSYFSKQPEDFAARTSMVDAVFSVLLANANEPMTAQEIAEKLQRPAETVLRTLAGPQVYQGIRPILEEED
jgi:methyltransferase-like protein